MFSRTVALVEGKLGITLGKSKTIHKLTADLPMYPNYGEFTNHVKE